MKDQSYDADILQSKIEKLNQINKSQEKVISVIKE